MTDSLLPSSSDTFEHTLMDEDEDSPIRPDDPRLAEIAKHFRAILQTLHLDLDDPNLITTPERVARMYLEVFSGLDVETKPHLQTFPNSEHYSQIISVRDIPYYSVCAHHFLPFFGRAHIAYIPDERLVGLSKLARLVDFYARRPQLQERLTEQIIDYLQSELQPKGSMVVVQGNHLCMEMRGVKKPGAVTTTSAIRGVFETRAVREEFLELLQKA